MVSTGGQPVHSSELEIELLGGFRVTVGGHVVASSAWRRRKPAALLKLLALAPGHRVYREQAMDALWPELDPAAAGANLRKAVHHARGALEDAEAGASALIISDGDFITLAPEGFALDIARFRSTLAGARRAGAIPDYERALHLYQGDLLPEDRYEEWAIAPRRDLHLDFLDGLTELVALLEARGDIAAAMEAARRLVAAEPTREESNRSLIRLYALAGRRGDALRQYETLVEVLDEELGAEPDPETQKLYEEIRARRADQPELTADLWERVGDLRVMSGDAVGASKAFGQALDADATVAATARIERKCGEALLMQHRSDEAAPHLAAAEAQTTDAAEQGRVARALANLAWETGDIERAARCADQALGIAREHGTDDDIAAAHEALAIVSHFTGQWRDGLTSEFERLASEEGAAQLARVYDIHHCIGQYHLYGDGLSDSVEGYARAILDRAEEANAVRAQAFAWCLLGEALLLEARWEESEGCLARSCELHTALGSRSGSLPWQRRAELAACRGDFEDVHTYLREASAIATVSPMARHMWGRIYATGALATIEQGDPEEAVRFVQAAAAAGARYGDCPTCSALLNPAAAEAYAALGDASSAQAYAGAAAGVAAMFSSSAWQAMADSAAGSAALAAGDTATARRSFEAARASYEAAGQPYWTERSARLGALTPA
jgi:DNA-binding SARP family transcriptional activator